MSTDIDPRDDLSSAVERFLYTEAALADDRAFSAWLELFATECRYIVRIRTITDTGAKTGLRSAVGSAVLCDDDREFLTHRVARLERDLSACEKPPSLTRRLITNVVATRIDADRVEARSNFLLYQNRIGEALLAGSRCDLLAPDGGGGFVIERREATLDHTTLPRTLTVLL